MREHKIQWRLCDSLSHFDVVLRPPVPDLDEDESEVVDEEEGVGVDDARIELEFPGEKSANVNVSLRPS